MAAARFKQEWEAVMAEHKKEFEEFSAVHKEFMKDQKRWSGKFNQLGKPIMEYIQAAEKRLCAKTERSGHGAYATKLSEKFREEVKKHFPLIDFVGVSFE